MPQLTLEKTQDYLILKIPLESVKSGKAELSANAQNILNEAIAEGLHDIESDRISGPFKNSKELAKSLRQGSSLLFSHPQ